jgi:methane/ammonia monooxygenase subunit B
MKMRKMIRKACALLALAVGITVMTPALPASAHGERAQEAFLRMSTVAWWDVTYSKAEVQQGEELKVTGTVKVLDEWPEQLGEPEMGYLNIVVPGPVMLVKERLINGQPTPAAFEIQKGGVYDFELTIVGRRVGEWHVHPILGVHHTGSLLGPGQFVNVTENPAGFTNDITLVNGETDDLETMGVANLSFWNIVWIALGLVWLLYWIVPKRTVTRLPVTSQIPLNTDGMAYGLITKKDHKSMNVIMGVTVVLLVAGWIWQAQAYPVKMPQQVLRYEPAALEMDPEFIEARAVGAVFDPDSDTMTMTVNVENTGDSPASITEFTTTTLTFPVHDAAGERSVQVSPSASIAPGESTTIQLAITDEIWEEERLIPIGESRMQVTGVIRFKDEAGKENFATVQSFVRPTKFH